MTVEPFINYSNIFPIPGLKAGFSTRHLETGSPDDRIALSNYLKLDSNRLVIPKQVHSTKVQISEKPGNFQQVDGLYTTRQDLVLSIQVADCIPVYFIDKQKQSTALIHAGWRGLTKGIITKAITSFVNDGSSPGDIYTILGPSIRQEAFEVGQDIIDLFDDDYVEQKPDGKYKVDLQGLATKECIKSGINQEYIFDSCECTYSNPDKYHSYRRDGSKAGRMVAIIGWSGKN